MGLSATVPRNVTHATSFSIFKTCIKEFLLKSYGIMIIDYRVKLLENYNSP